MNKTHSELRGSGEGSGDEAWVVVVLSQIGITSGDGFRGRMRFMAKWGNRNLAWNCLIKIT